VLLFFAGDRSTGISPLGLLFSPCVDRFFFGGGGAFPLPRFFFFFCHLISTGDDCAFILWRHRSMRSAKRSCADDARVFGEDIRKCDDGMAIIWVASEWLGGAAPWPGIGYKQDTTRRTTCRKTRRKRSQRVKRTQRDQFPGVPTITGSTVRSPKLAIKGGGNQESEKSPADRLGSGKFEETPQTVDWGQNESFANPIAETRCERRRLSAVDALCVTAIVPL